MSFVEEEITSQPEVWRQAAALAAELEPPLLPDGSRVALFGCGTSLYMARAIAAMREASGLGESDAFAASEFPPARDYDLAVALSRSGTTTEVIGLCRRLAPSIPVTAVTADPHTPLADVVSRLIAMPFADEQSVVQTRFATATLALFRTALGDDLGAATDDAQRALTDPLPVADAADIRQLVFLATGWRIGLAEEAALKVREAAQAWSEAYPAMEYRHGPIAVAGPGTIVWALDDLPEGLKGQIEETGARLVAPVGDPMSELVRIQRLAVSMAAARRLDPDQPRHLTRSVVLEGAAHAS